MNSELKEKQIYAKDPKAYYDPTLESKRLKKLDLGSALDKIREDLMNESPVFTEENFKIPQKIQNKRNHNTEIDNEFINDSYLPKIKRLNSKN